MSLKKLKKQLLRFDRAKTEKTLIDSASEIMKHYGVVDTDKLSKKEKNILKLMLHTYKIRTYKKWQILLNKRKQMKKKNPSMK
uniref:Uncharacterized protein n=1 Tax=viral metagenome TaxID=1070528 RepID=A0A6C0F642_9ZZZZ|tara:strand:- start:13964 stop:14212 length:249 start_codon:yes stop_codon:yes gene_type:complete